MGDTRAPLNKNRTPPYKTAGMIFAFVAAVFSTLIWFQFRGYFRTSTELYVLASRAGLALDPGSKVTYNGVPIGRLRAVDVVPGDDGRAQARLVLDVEPRYLNTLPRNAEVRLSATTAFGNKYVAFASPKVPSPQRLRAGDQIDAIAVTTEFNTLFETIMAISERIDPVKVNMTLTAAAQALDGLGDKFGQSLAEGTDILADLVARMPALRHDMAAVADLADAYTHASPDLWDGLNSAVTSARTIHDQSADLDRALMAAVGYGDTAADSFERGGPYLVRGAQDLMPTARLLAEYSPEFDCTFRGVVRAAPALAKAIGGNGYSLEGPGTLVGGGNPYVYPDNLPRINASGGPMGRPGCWQVTKDILPMPYLVMDVGASIAPYNHIGLNSPLVVDYVWGRQLGERTINP
ncbi:MCE-family protein MCE1A [Mycolicibacterium mucogenicum]|uniref:MCE-family protein MCE1A n=2 Tax=Mycolicibacterium mucogenicum TaxID=56689 RepID=A0A1A3GWK0_MYCMU|nr:MCE family protein [Mycolicibacterium mucogenicum]OBJ39724.1 MCE-family protein MCE1A [Mycolicibacterium mucogenicum]